MKGERERKKNGNKNIAKQRNTLLKYVSRKVKPKKGKKKRNK